MHIDKETQFRKHIGFIVNSLYAMVLDKAVPCARNRTGDGRVLVSVMPVPLDKPHSRATPATSRVRRLSLFSRYVEPSLTA